MIQIQINLYQRIILNKSIFVRTIERLPWSNKDPKTFKNGDLAKEEVIANHH